MILNTGEAFIHTLIDRMMLYYSHAPYRSRVSDLKVLTQNFLRKEKNAVNI